MLTQAETQIALKLILANRAGEIHHALVLSLVQREMVTYHPACGLVLTAWGMEQI